MVVVHVEEQMEDFGPGKKKTFLMNIVRIVTEKNQKVKNKSKHFGKISCNPRNAFKHLVEALTELTGWKGRVLSETPPTLSISTELMSSRPLS